MTFSLRCGIAACLLSTYAIGRSGQAGNAELQATAPVLQGAVSVQPCDVPGVAGGGRCGTYSVYEDRSTRTGRKISLNILVIPALGANPLPDPVFWLEGGPGGAATQAAGPVSQNYFPGLRNDRDLVFVDAGSRQVQSAQMR